MVLNGVVRPTREESGNSGPFIAETSVGSEDGIVFFRRKGPVLNLGRELVTPS